MAFFELFECPHWHVIRGKITLFEYFLVHWVCGGEHNCEGHRSTPPILLPIPPILPSYYHPTSHPTHPTTAARLH